MGWQVLPAGDGVGARDQVSEIIATPSDAAHRSHLQLFCPLADELLEFVDRLFSDEEESHGAKAEWPYAMGHRRADMKGYLHCWVGAKPVLNHALVDHTHNDCLPY